MRRAVVVSETKIISRLIDGDTFVFPYKDMKTCIFDPVTSNILHHIEIAISKCNRLTGVFIFGAIGYDKYLEELVHEKFDIAVWTNNNPYGVSEALVAYGAQHDNVSVPYFIYKEIKQKSITRIPGNEGLEFTEKSVKEIKHSNVDYVIGLGIIVYEP
jgi:hypothetical protein